MRLIRQATTSGVVVVDPESTDPIVIANPGLPSHAITERAKPHLSRRRQLDLDRQLHGGMATGALYAVVWGAVAGLLVVCVALTMVWMVARGPLRIPPAPPVVDVGTPGSVPPVTGPPSTTRPPHAGTKAGVWPAPPTTTTAPPTTTTAPAPPGQAGKTPPGLAGVVGRRVGQLRQQATTTTLDPDELEQICELLDLPCPDLTPL